MTDDMLGPYKLNTIVTGDARELAKAIPDESVDLIFTDPVYDRIDDYRWLAETAARVLKPGGNLVMYQAQVYLPDTLVSLCGMAGLVWRWPIFDHKVGTQSTVWGPRVLGRTRMALVYYKPPRPNSWLVDFVPSYPNGRAANHDWSKNPTAASNWILRFNPSLVLDPFVGGGTHSQICSQFRIPYLAFEIDPDTADLARERVRNTQPPLPIDMPVQDRLF